MIEPDLLYSVLCDDIRHEHNGKHMLIGLFENIAVRTFPYHHPRMCVMNKWCNGEGRWTQCTRFVDANDVVLLASENIEFELPSLEAVNHIVQVFGGLLIPAPGRISVEILLNGELKQRYALNVSQLPPPAA